jgi:predicted DNA binding CopG/RHH family protein
MKAKSKLKDGKFDYGKVELTDEEYRESQNPKLRTTMFFEADLIRAYKQEATKRGMKYQQLMREKLKDALDSPTDIETRLQRLESKVLKKKRIGT